MMWIKRLTNVFKRVAEGVKNMADLGVDDQWKLIAKHLEQENTSYTKQFERLYLAGWFKMTGNRGGQQLSHCCPRCKQLSTGKAAVHCSGQKRERRPEGWRLLFVKQAPSAF